jgi:hypothetical protein
MKMSEKRKEERREEIRQRNRSMKMQKSEFERQDGRGREGTSKGAIRLGRPVK